jgi:hypothetical protein
MPGFPFPGRPGGEHDEPLLDMIIARRVLPPDAPQVMHDLASMLAALAGPAEPGELAGEAAVRAAFSQAASPAGISSADRRPVRRRRSPRPRRPSRSRARLATAMVAAVAGLGSVLAAYTDVLPSPIQQLAHVAVFAPAPPGTATHSSVSRRTGRSVPARPGPSTISQAAARPDPSPGTPSRGGQTSTQPGRRRPRPSASAGHGSPSPVCSRGSWSTPGLPGRASSGPSSPAGSQPFGCGGIPTGPSVQPTLNPTPALVSRGRGPG